MQQQGVKRGVPGGLVVVFEGIDGSGKTTQLKKAEAALAARGWDVVSTRNLGGTPIGEKLRQVILSHLERPPTANLYISAAVQEALIEHVQSLRSQGKIILLDRGPLSLAAYEIYGNGLDVNLGWPLVDSGMKRLKPELVLLYEADIKIALERTKHGTGKADYFESKSESYFKEVAEGYSDIAKKFKNIVSIDASLSIEMVHSQTMLKLERILNIA